MPRARTLSTRLATLAATAAVGVAGVVALGTTVAGPAGAVECKPNLVLGIPGTNQGAQHEGDGSDAHRYGDEVNTVLQALSYANLDYRAEAVDYRATGIDISGAHLKNRYDKTEYTTSQQEGFAAAYATLKQWAKDCPSSKLSVVGYSQGAHIAGDLVHSMTENNPDFKPGQLGYAVLLADARFNSESPNTEEFRYDYSDFGARPGDSSFDYDKHVLVRDSGHWSISGIVGKRKNFADSDPVLSLCVYGDPICDGADINPANVDDWATLAGKKWMHSLYTPVRYDNAHNLAEWAGQQMSDKLK